MMIEVELDGFIPVRDDSTYVLQRFVKMLHFGEGSEKEVAAREIEKLAAGDVKTRKLLANLGVIPVLISILGASESSGCRRAAVKALKEMGNGTHTNKVLMVETGIFTIMPHLVTIEEDDPAWTEALVSLLHSLTATHINSAFTLSPEILRFLNHVLIDSDQTHSTKMACLVTLHHLSTTLHHATTLVSSYNTIHTLIRLTSDSKTSERALLTLGNLVVTKAGKEVIEADNNVPNCFIEVLAWEDIPKSQELALYLLMILAHGSSIQKEKMARCGIVQKLLGVVLLGSHLAQKRALKILQWFKDEKQIRIIGFQKNRKEQTVKERRVLFKKMVKQSLNKNMELIMERAHVLEGNSNI